MQEHEIDPRSAAPAITPDLDRLLVHGRTVFLVCLGLTRDRADAEDLAQETFLRACRQPGRVPDGDEARAWLCAVARNVCRDHARRRRFRLSVWPLLWAVEPDAPDPHADLERREEHDALRRALAHLPRRHREVLVLREYAGLPYSEIARVLGIEAGTVMSRLNRARQKLAEAVQGRGVTR